MKVIALLGEESCGKSHTINILYSLLLHDGFKQVSGKFKELGDTSHKDFRDVLEKKDGEKIGIVSMGDYVKNAKEDNRRSVKSLLEDLEKDGCIISFCACRPCIKDAVKGYENTIVNKKGGGEKSLHRISDYEHAKKMLDELKKQL